MHRRWGNQTINVGDRITFKAATRSSHRKATRMVTGFTINGRPEVRYEGWADFVVSPWEIIEVKNEVK